MICSNCNVLMRFVMRFDGDKMYRLRRCPKCYFETKQVPLILEEETRQNNYKSKQKKTPSIKPSVSKKTKNKKKAKKR